MNNIVNPPKDYLLKKLILDIVYPNRCPFCDEIISYNRYFHEECTEQLDMLDYNNDYQKSNDTISVCLYNEKSKEFIFKAKENGNGYAISAAAFLLYKKLAEHGSLKNIDMITSIPPKKSSLCKRGYCFPMLMAREIGKLAKLPYNGKIFIHLDKGTEQKELSAKERTENVKNAFALKKTRVDGCRVLLIDDVRTTGATLAAAENVLVKAGAVEVVKAAFAVVG